jgi:hypothetical protein
MPFLEQGSKCDIAQSRGLLQFHDKFKELICLFQSRNMHLQALQLLSQCGQTPAPGQLTGTEPSVIYLQNLVEQCTERPEYVKLVLDFSKWILLKEPEEGLRIFTHCHENGNVALGIPPFTVLDHLKKTSDREVCIAYLESLVYTGETNPYFHNELIFLYLDGVSNLLPKKPTSPTEQPQAPHTTEAKTTVVAPVEAKQKKKRVTAGMEAGRLGILRRKLIEFLKSSVHYNPEKMLSWFPRDELLEERAILLSRINQHLQALTIYAHKLHDPEIAEQYCAEYYNAQSEEEKQMYLHLFRVYLQPPEDLHPRAEPLVKPALTLLAKHYDRIDSNEALRLLPNDTNIRDLMPFFKNVLTSVKHKRRTNQIKKNLLMAEHRRVRLQSLDTARPRILLDKHTACMKCKKKIGAHSAFARLPTGEVIHYICYSVKNQ